MRFGKANLLALIWPEIWRRRVIGQMVDGGGDAASTSRSLPVAGSA